MDALSLGCEISSDEFFCSSINNGSYYCDGCWFLSILFVGLEVGNKVIFSKWFIVEDDRVRLE